MTIFYLLTNILVLRRNTKVVLKATNPLTPVNTLLFVPIKVDTKGLKNNKCAKQYSLI